MLPLVMFTGEIADAKVVLHRERRKKKKKMSFSWRNILHPERKKENIIAACIMHIDLPGMLIFVLYK